MKSGQEQLTFLNMLLFLFALGVLAAAEALPPFSYAFSSAALLLIFSFFAVRNESGKAYIFIAALFFLLGALRFTAEWNLPQTDISNHAGNEREITGIVTESLNIEDEGKLMRVRALVEIETVRTKEGVLKGSGKAYVHFRQDKNKPLGQIGDRIKVRGRVTGIYGYDNPGRIDTVLTARSKGITARIFAQKNMASFEARDGFMLQRVIESVRQKFLRLMESVMPREDAAAIFAMLFGGYAGIKPELVEAFSTTGIVHILSVSGSHITLLLTTLALFGKKLGVKKSFLILPVIIAVFAYCLLAQGVAPAVRSGIMGCVAFFGRVNARENDARRLLTLTGLLLLIISPLLVFDITFQLSFASTAGLLYISPRIAKLLAKLPYFVRTALSVTIGAQLAVLPLLAWYFKSVSLSALIANLIVVPVVEFMIILGLAAGIVGFCLPFVGKLFFFADSLLLGIVYEATRLIASLPYSAVYLPVFGVYFAALYYAVLIFLLQKEERREEIISALKAYRYPAAIFFLAIIVFIGVRFVKKHDEMSVHFIDVGQGDAALIITPNGKGVMVDCGGTRDNAYDVGGRVVVPYLLHHGVRELETVYLTHAHEDHAAGAASILKKLPVKAVITGNEERKEYEKSLGLPVGDEAWSKFYTAKQGEVRQIDGVKFEVVYAPQEKGKDNEASIIVKATYKQASFLFTGDLTGDKEKSVLKTAESKCTVLKVAHHGSKTSSTAEFLRSSSPVYALISVSAGNTFGHPASEVLKRLSSSGAKIFRTDRDGAVTFYTDGENMRIETFNETRLKAFRK